MIVIIGTSVVDTCSVDRILIHYVLSMVNIKMCVCVVCCFYVIFLFI